MEFERRNYAALPQPSGAFHHSVRSGNTLYIAGSTAGGTSAATGDIAANVVKVTSFVTDLREAPAAGEVRMKRFAGAFPASTQVQVAALGTPDLKIEIDAIAILPD